MQVRLLRVGLFLLAVCAVAADDIPKVPWFPTAAYYRQNIRTPQPRIEMQGPVKFQDYIVDGKLELSMRSYLDLVLANNTDMQIQRLAVEVPRNNILRSAGIFDPTLFTSFTATRQNTPTNDVLQGANTLSQLTQPLQFRYNQTLTSGAQVTGLFNTNKLSNNNQFQLFNPALNTNLNFSFTQPLLRGRGAYITKLPITIARSRVRQQQYNVEDQLLRLVTQAEGAYWDVIAARENLRVQEQALALADTSLKRAQRELELGAISSLEIYQPQAVYANAEILVTQARYRLTQTEDALRRQMSADLDPNVRGLPMVLTEPIAPPTQLKLDRDDLVQKALRLRPDLKSQRQALDIDDLSLQQTTNALRPNLSITGQYGAAGRGGPFSRRVPSLDPNNPGSVVQVTPGGWGDAFDQLFGFGFPVYGAGLTLNLPLRDRRAAADYADAVVNKRLDTLRVRAVEQQVRLDVLNAITQVENSRASVDLAKVALDLAQKRVDADQKRYDLGTITLFFLLDSQNALTQSQSNLVNQSVNYRRNLLNLQRFTGELLAERGIAVQ